MTSSSTLPNPNKKLSKSAYDLNKITSRDINHIRSDKHKSTSLQHLEDSNQIHNYRYNNDRHVRIFKTPFTPSILIKFFLLFTRIHEQEIYKIFLKV